MPFQSCDRLWAWMWTLTFQCLPGAWSTGWSHMGAATRLLAAKHELLYVVRGSFDCLEISEGRDPKTWHAVRIPLSVSGQWLYQKTV